MLLHNCSFLSTSNRLLHSINQTNKLHYDDDYTTTNRGYPITRRRRRRRRRRTVNVSSMLASISVGTDMIVEIAHNKALIAATVCGAFGQLAKPFAASILYQKDFDLKSVFQAGGFPSTHSSAAVATAMSVGLERGFSDSVFGLAVVFAALTMYDAQGVRREVGVHARTLNKALTTNQPNTYSSSKKLSLNPESGNSHKMDETSNLSPVITSDRRVNSSCLTDDIGNGSESSGPISSPLKESIGHTEIEVAAGALLGLVASLVVYSL
ncbi:uncharacterized protein [Rutidosis leptorrhynchoides]|uniref:uncharacterized protein n=1 Tax=Rutidosis leptorrhynchoides TaxID=125765 RepID=UPI003A99B006